MSHRRVRPYTVVEASDSQERARPPNVPTTRNAVPFSFTAEVFAWFHGVRARAIVAVRDTGELKRSVASAEAAGITRQHRKQCLAGPHAVHGP